jgi:hypothetical protein
MHPSHAQERVGAAGGSVRDRKARMGICLYQREARTSENGPPPEAAGAAAAQAPRVSVHSGRT